jgi:hypothetical protein
MNAPTKLKLPANASLPETIAPLGNRNKFMTIYAISEPQRMSFLGTSFKGMESVLLDIMGSNEFPIRLTKEKHLEGVRWALAACGEAREPWQQLLDSLNKFGIIEVHIED